MPITTGDKSRRRSLATRLATKCFLALLFFVSSGAVVLYAQTIQIKLVNGKTGRSVADVCVSVWMTGATRATASIRADKDGVARLFVTHKDNEVDLSYNLKLGCGGNGAINPVFKYADSLSVLTSSDHPSCAFPESMPNARVKEMDFPPKDVLEHGVVSANTCGKVTASPKPGEVIIFVRPRTFHEKVDDWKASEYFPL